MYIADDKCLIFRKKLNTYALYPNNKETQRAVARNCVLSEKQKLELMDKHFWKKNRIHNIQLSAAAHVNSTTQRVKSSRNERIFSFYIILFVDV